MGGTAKPSARALGARERPATPRLRAAFGIRRGLWLQNGATRQGPRPARNLQVDVDEDRGVLERPRHRAFLLEVEATITPLRDGTSRAEALRTT